ncbi:hypothetical protein ACFWIZ_05480 [Streptomyces sp. NPDC127044]
MDNPMNPQLVFVHGIGAPRDPNAELTAWKHALAEASAPPEGRRTSRR